MGFSTSLGPNRAQARRAFTLLEILVVLAIIGLLVGLVVSNTDKPSNGVKPSNGSRAMGSGLGDWG